MLYLVSFNFLMHEKSRVRSRGSRNASRGSPIEDRGLKVEVQMPRARSRGSKSKGDFV